MVEHVDFFSAKRAKHHFFSLEKPGSSLRWDLENSGCFSERRKPVGFADMWEICSHFNIFGNMVPMILILKKNAMVIQW